MSDNESQALKITRQSINATVAIIVAIFAGVIYYYIRDAPAQRVARIPLAWLKFCLKASQGATKLVKRVATEIGIYRTIQIIIAVVSGFFLIINAWALSATFSVGWYTAGSLITIFSYGLALLFASLTLLKLRAIKMSGIQNISRSGLSRIQTNKSRGKQITNERQ